MVLFLSLYKLATKKAPKKLLKDNKTCDLIIKL